MLPPTIMSNNAITVCFEDGPVTIKNGATNGDQFIAVREAIKDQDYDKVKALMSPAKWITSKIESQEFMLGGEVEFRDEIIYYNGEPTKNYITDRIIQMSQEGFTIEPMLKFLKKLYENPSASAREELYQFLETAQIPITEDGDVLCFKKVRHDYFDFYTQTMDNSPGKIVEMDRKTVDTDRNRTCSYGLHVCAPSYLSQYHSGFGKVIRVVVNPRDFVSIPVDYNFAKARVSKYLVLGDVGDAVIGENLAAAEKNRTVRRVVDHVDQPEDDERDPLIYQIETILDKASSDQLGPFRRNSEDAVIEACDIALALAKLYTVDTTRTYTFLELYEEQYSDVDPKKAGSWFKARAAIIEKVFPNFFDITTVPGKASTVRFSGSLT